MKVTEQIDAMEVAAINPFKYLVVTRILATTLMVPLLVIFADGVGMLGGFIGINMYGDVSLFRYITKVFDSLAFIDIIPATIKTFFFGFFIGMIGCYKGFNAENGTASVGQAANSAVVTASLTIFIIDMLAVQLTDLFFKMEQGATIILPPVKNEGKVPVIEIKGLVKSFGENNHVLKGVSLSLNKGEDLVILGRSGSGKSITIKCIVGLVLADEGEIKVFGHDIVNLDSNKLNEIRIRIGFLFQNAALYDSMTVKQNLPSR